MTSSKDIHDMIQKFTLDATESPDQTASRLLDILDATNRRMDEIENKLEQKIARLGVGGMNL